MGSKVECGGNIDVLVLLAGSAFWSYFETCWIMLFPLDFVDAALESSLQIVVVVVEVRSATCFFHVFLTQLKRLS